MQVAWFSPLFGFLFLLLGGPARAQSTVVIRGTVVDATTGESLFGAGIWLRRAAVGTSAQGASFTLSCPRSEQADTLVISYVGYQRKRLVVVPRADLQLAISLRPATSLALAPVEVRAKQPIAEDFVLQKLDYLAIVTNPAAAADPLRAVQTLPAATNTDESANVSLRGSDPSQTGIYLNNAPVYDAVKFAQLNGIGTFSIFNPDLIKSLLVFPSNPPLEFSNAGAGLIALNTDEKRTPASVEVGLGLAGASLFAARPVGSASMLKAFGNFQTAAGLRALNPHAFSDLTSLRMGDGGLHYASPLGKGGTLKLVGYGITEHYGYRYEGPTVADTYRYTKNRGLYTGSYERFFAKSDLSFSQMVSFSKSSTAVGNYHTRQTNADWYGAAAYRYYWSDALSTRVGVSFDQRAVRVAGQFPLYAYALGTTAPTSTDTLFRRRSLWEAYHYTKLNLGTWVVGLGLRTSLPGAAFHYQSYQASVRYNLSSAQFLNLSGGQYHTVTTPDPALFPFQLTRTRQLALDYAYTGTVWTATAAAYYKQAHGLSSTTIVGAETYVQRTFGKRISASLSAASVRMRASDVPLLNGGLSYTPALRDIPFNLKSSWQVAFPWVVAAVVAQYRSGTPYTPVVGSTYASSLDVYQPLYAPVANEDRLPTYFRTDLNLTKQLDLKSKHASVLVYAVLNNVFNNKNASGYLYNADYSARHAQYFQLRSVYLGLVASFD